MPRTFNTGPYFAQATGFRPGFRRDFHSHRRCCHYRPGVDRHQEVLSQDSHHVADPDPDLAPVSDG